MARGAAAMAATAGMLLLLAATSGTTVAAGDSRGGGGRRLEGAGSRCSTSAEVTLPIIHHRALSSLLAGTEGVAHATHTGPVI